MRRLVKVKMKGGVAVVVVITIFLVSITKIPSRRI